MVTSHPEEQKLWKSILERHLGGFGEVLVEMAPNLKHILGEQTELLPLSGVENQQRIQFAINSFFEAISSTNRSIIFFLDDFQWANEASIELLSSILKNENLKNILILISYRSDEINESHPLQGCISDAVSLAEQVKNFNTSIIDVPPLDIMSLAKLISETLQEEIDEESEITKLIYQNTKGNPFAINKLLESLHERNIIYFNPSSSRWDWDLSDLNKEVLSEGILGILLSKIKSLDDQSLSVVKTAAAFGSDFQRIF